MDKETLMWIIQGLSWLLAVVAGMILSAQRERIQMLEERVQQHREDMLRNYPSHNDMTAFKQDVLQKIEDMGHSIKNSITVGILKNAIEEMKESHRS